MTAALPPIPPAVVRSFAECGVNVAALKFSYDELLQSDVVMIASSSGANTQMFPCIRKASWSKFDVHFEDASLEKLYREYEEQQGKMESKRQALEWLAARNMREALPPFLAGDDAIEFAHTLESFCGIQPGEAIQPIEPKSWTFRRSFMTFPPNPKFECLLNAMMASDLESHGIKLGFIGNEAFADPVQKAPK